MYKCEREDEILELLSQTEYATVEYLAKKTCISPSSIRRDLKNLENRGLVIRSYGGVRLAQSTGKRIPFDLRSHENCTLKKQIAKAAVELLNPGDVVFLDGSSSAYFVAERLVEVGGITVVTNNIDAMSLLSSYDVKAYCTGGVLSSENRSVLVGEHAQAFLRNIHADVCLFSVQALGADGRFYDCYDEEVAVRNLMLANSARHILLCDSTKLGKTSTFYQGSVEDLTQIVSDAELTAFFLDPTPEKYVYAP